MCYSAVTTRLDQVEKFGRGGQRSVHPQTFILELDYNTPYRCLQGSQFQILFQNPKVGRYLSSDGFSFGCAVEGIKESGKSQSITLLIVDKIFAGRCTGGSRCCHYYRCCTLEEIPSAAAGSIMFLARQSIGTTKYYVG